MNAQAVNTLFYRLWFPKSSSDITIVAPPEDIELEDAKLTSPNYALLDKLGDRDSIFAIGKLLSRKYQNANIHLISSSRFEDESLSRNYVVIGGPGGVCRNEQTGEREPYEGNEACRVFSTKIGSGVSYSDDCEAMVVDGGGYKSKYDSRRYMTVDYGCFAAFTNPVSRTKRIIMVHGTHTLGVLGATRAFDGLADSYENFGTMKELLEGKLEGRTEFETFFEVAVTNGEVSCPRVDGEVVFPITKERVRTAKARYGVSEVEPGDENAEVDLVSLLRIAKNDAVGEKKRLMEQLEENLEGRSLGQDRTRAIRREFDRNPKLTLDSIKEINRIVDSND